MRQDFPYVYSNEAKLRISIINKYWKPPNSTLRKQLGGRDPNNKFDGFRVINYHSFVNTSDSTGKSPPKPEISSTAKSLRRTSGASMERVCSAT